MIDKQDVKKNQVRQVYGERARHASKLAMLSSVDAVCCANGTIETEMDNRCGAYSDIYSQGDLVGIPSSTIASSAGCGNPTALAGLKAGERVLDLGSGGGLDCFLAARQVGSAGHVIGLDMTADMLALARKNAKRLSISNVEFIEGFIEKIPLPDSNVDVVISNCVVCLSPDKDAVARESFRVLTPGGRLHVSDMVALGPMPQELREDPQLWARCTSGSEEEEAYLKHLRSAGFVDIDIKHDGGPHLQKDNMPDIVAVKIVAYKP